jgi:rhodanese-related sulfurtransferase
MGTLQAHLTLAILLELSPTVLGRLVSVDFRTLRFSGFSFASATEPAAPTLRFIAPEEVLGADLVIDLRSLTEAPVSPFPGALRVGVDDIERAGLPDTPTSRVVLCCRSGIRAWRAARALQRVGCAELALIALGD